MTLTLPKYRDKKTGEIKQQATWRYEFRVAGRRVVGSAGTPDRAKAEAKMNAHRNRLLRGIEQRRSSDGDRKVLIGSDIYLYRQKAPFVASGMSISGAVEFDDVKQAVKCHECGGWFQFLGVHIAKGHPGLTVDEYKIKHSLGIGTALLSEKIRNVLVGTSKSWHSRNPEHLAAVGFKVGHSAKRLSGSRGLLMEHRNKKGRCPAQILQHIRDHAEKIGRAPTSTEFWCSTGLHPKSVTHLFGQRSFTEVQKLAGLMPHRSSGGRPKGTKGQPKYSRAVLVEMMRDHRVRFDRLPTGSDYRRGFLPSRATYVKAFGSMENAYFAAGFEKLAALDGRRISNGRSRSNS